MSLFNNKDDRPAGWFRDPVTGDASSARLAAILLAAAGVFIVVTTTAVAAVVAMTTGDATVISALLSTGTAAMVSAVVGSGAVAIWRRSTVRSRREVYHEVEEHAEAPQGLPDITTDDERGEDW